MVYYTMPIVIRATFVFSGIFRLQLEKRITENRQPSFKIDLAFNLSSPFEPTHRISPYQSNISGCKPGSTECLKTADNAMNNKTFHSKIEEASKMKECGPGKCSSEEMCVTWMKHTQVKTLKYVLQSPLVVHECLPNNGSHLGKMNPTGAKLCEKGKTHSILKESQPCLLEHPPCELTWKYICVDEKESPHSCSIKKCRNKGACVEVIHCDLQPPCYKEATCLPNFLISRP